MLPCQLDGWLQKGDNLCLAELQEYMCDQSPAADDIVALSQDLLAALKRAVGKNGKYNTFMPLR